MQKRDDLILLKKYPDDSELRCGFIGTSNNRRLSFQHFSYNKDSDSFVRLGSHYFEVPADTINQLREFLCSL